VAEASRAVIRAAKAAGVCVFGGGIDVEAAPVLVASDGIVTPGTSPETKRLDGGFCVLDVETRREAEAWAARLAGGCRCARELRQFMFDPES
jgi:hypothetical protein